jgi:hypothetical protein
MSPSAGARHPFIKRKIELDALSLNQLPEFPAGNCTDGNAVRRFYLFDQVFSQGKTTGLGVVPAYPNVSIK